MKPLVQHYDKEYYQVHYAQYLDDQAYTQAIATFYKRAIFDELKLSARDRVLDFGSGPGHLTLALEADCYDPSAFIHDYLKKKNRKFYSNPAEIPKANYRAVFSSHSLEHCLNPAVELKGIHAFLEEKGLLILVLPKETIPGKPTSSVDDNMHLYTWNFQLITNLLSTTGYRVVTQRIFYGPYGLRTLSKRTSVDTAALWAFRLGCMVRNYPSLLTIAEKI